MTSNTFNITWNEELIRRYNLAGPRYTSYPTAPQFSSSFSENTLKSAIERSNANGGPLSLYFHIPFCDTVCYYCACNKIVTANKRRADPYLARLHEEIAMKASSFDQSRPVRQLHWGGGTPTFISIKQMRELMECTAQHFNLVTDDTGEYSIEIHPAGVKPETIQHLRQLGFNRLSMGIQDFDDRTQKAVNRFNDPEQVKTLIEAIRKEDFHSISMDLIYGLPYQSVATFNKTLRKIIELSPDRISLFNYAHLPHLFKTQRQIDELALPPAKEKLDIFHNAINLLCGAGYVYIGMDHFAKPDDALALTQKQGELQRNFQGYSTHGSCDLIGFGVSAISAIDNIYVQNHKAIEDYNLAIDTGSQPLSCGVTLNQDDKIRQKVIYDLICHFSLRFADIEEQFGISFKEYFDAELHSLEPLAEDQLLSVDDDSITVLDQGRLLIRRICMLFDAYLTRQPEVRYSQII